MTQTAQHKKQILSKNKDLGYNKATKAFRSKITSAHTCIEPLNFDSSG